MAPHVATTPWVILNVLPIEQSQASRLALSLSTQYAGVRNDRLERDSAGVPSPAMEVD